MVPIWMWLALSFDVIAPVATTPELEEIGLTHRQGVWIGDTLILVYHARVDGIYQIFLRRWWGAWDPPVRITWTSADAKWPSLVRDLQDSLHLAWHDYRVDGIRNVEIFYTACTPALSCAPEVRLTYTQGGGVGDNSYVPVLMWDRSDTLRMVWYDYRDDPTGARARIYYTARPPDAPWDTASQIPLSPPETNAWFPFLLRSGDTLVVLWSDNASGTYQIRMRRKAAVWLPVETPFPSPTAQGYPHATWTRWGLVLTYTEGTTVRVASSLWGPRDLGPGDKPHLLRVGSIVWVLWHQDSAVIGMALDSLGVPRDSFRLDRSGSLTHPYAGVWGTLTPGGRLLLIWSETHGSERDLYWALSAPVGAQTPPQPIVVSPPPVDVLGRRIPPGRRPSSPGRHWGGPHPSWILLPGGHRFGIAGGEPGG